MTLDSSTTPDFTKIATGLIDGRSAVSQPAVAPDGSRVASVVSTIDLEDNTVRRSVWIDGQPATAGPNDGNPTWSPDGKYLAFTSRRHPTADKKSHTTLHVLPVEAPGELRLVSAMPDGIGSPAWSPDGGLIAFASRTRHERYSAKDESWQSPRKIERFLSRLDGENWVADRPQHIYVVAANGTGGARNLTAGEFEYSSPAWLADSSGIVVSGRGSDDWDQSLAEDLYIFDLDGNRTALTGSTGVYVEPSVSPDGSMIAFLGFDDQLTYPQNVRVGILPTAGGPHRWLSTALDRTFAPTAGRRAPVWVDHATVLSSAEDRGETHLFEVFTDGSIPKPLTSGPLTVADFDARNGRIATIRSTVQRPAELWVGATGEATQITEVAASHTGWEKFAVPTADGTDEIDAWIMLPSDFDPDQTWPLLLNVHGGPFTQYGEYFFDEAQIQAAAGFVVVMSNPRGGSGRHTSWGQSIMGPKHPTAAGTGWGTVDVDDVMSVLNYALEHFDYLDRERVGMLGGSYGGYMATLLAARYGDRFQAICSERAVNNLLTEDWSADIATFFRVEHGPNPVEDPEEYLRMSPICLARDIDVPMLLIHSEQDYRCPINQAEELWVTLKLLGKDVTFYRFPGEGHELSRNGSPLHRVQRAEIILRFFHEHLG